MTDQPNFGWPLLISGTLIYAMEYIGPENPKAFGEVVLVKHPRWLGRALRLRDGPIALLPAVVQLWGVALAAVGIGAITGVVRANVASIGYAVFVGGAMSTLLALVATVVATRLRNR